MPLRANVDWLLELWILLGVMMALWVCKETSFFFFFCDVQTEVSSEQEMM